MVLEDTFQSYEKAATLEMIRYRHKAAQQAEQRILVRVNVMILACRHLKGRIDEKGAEYVKNPMKPVYQRHSDGNEDSPEQEGKNWCPRRAPCADRAQTLRNR